ncbi:MAG: hypothetical protein KDD72_11905, partial [Anaerolineales bacterium]|nr:hypothetical protein [Anaerolineales bacterium]
ELDPNLQEAKDLLNRISYSIPEAVGRNDDGSFTLLGLTATPIPPTPWGGPATEAAPPSTPQAVAVTQTLSSLTSPPVETPGAQNPLCGSAFLLPALFGVAFVIKKRK